VALGIALGIPWGYASRRPWDPSQIPGVMHWWDSIDIADGMAAPAGDWTDRIASAVSTQVTPFWRDGELWNGMRTLRGVSTGAAIAFPAAAAWTLPGANVTIIHAFRALGDTGGAEWVCLASGNDGLSHRQWGLRGAAYGSDSPGLDAWNKNSALNPVETKLKCGTGWGQRYLTAFCAPSGNSMSVKARVGGALYTASNPAGYAGTYGGTTSGRIAGSSLGTQSGLFGALRAIVVVAGQVSAADLGKLATYFGVP